MADLLSFRCKNCGASVSFDTDSQKMKCPHCDSLFSVYDFKDSKTVWQQEEADSIQLFECSTCGGHIGLDSTSTSVFCPYCDGTAVVRERLTGKSRPEYIIPFKVDKSQAILRFKKHLKSQKLLPKLFKSDAKIRECKGIYVPFWVFSTKAEIASTITVYTGNKYESTVCLTCKVKAPVKHLPIDCCEKIPNEITESLEPFDFGNAVRFEPGYLAGYFADMHDTDKDECIKHATTRITKGIRKKITEQVTRRYGTIQKFDEFAPHFYDSHAIYAFYPVWMINVSWKKRRYTFAVNGQTGKFAGNLPCSYKQLFSLFFKIFGTIFGIGCALMLIASVIMK